MGKSMKMCHLDGNIMAAVDIETTGLEVGVHDIWQVCVIPLDNFLQPRQDISPFNIYMLPKRPQNIDKKAIGLSRETFDAKMQFALDPWKAADLLDAWFEKLNLPFHRNIIPLGFNYASFDQKFLIDWLGQKTYSYIFNYKIRDAFLFAQSLNDRASFQGEGPVYPHQALSAMCKYLNVENINPHDAMGDCLATAQCYQKMLQNSL